VNFFTSPAQRTVTRCIAAAVAGAAEDVCVNISREYYRFSKVETR